METSSELVQDISGASHYYIACINALSDIFQQHFTYSLSYRASNLDILILEDLFSRLLEVANEACEMID
jgi:hypothetical protein